MRSIFSITTNSHVPQGLAALNSLRNTFSGEENNRTHYTIFTTDNNSYKQDNLDNVNIVNINSLELPDYATLINRSLSRTLTKTELKQGVSLLDTIRWALKPCLLEYILSSYDDCIYIDSDIYFINPVTSIIDNIKNIGLSPHFRPYGTTEVFSWMISNNTIGDPNVFTDGYFNGGFFVAKNTPVSINAINWWKRCCLSRCEINKEIGFYVDQKYLDYMYMHFDGIQKIDDLGCNIAEWNIYTYNLSDINLETRSFVINNQFIPKFFHFSGSSYQHNHIMNFFYKEFCDVVAFYKN